MRIVRMIGKTTFVRYAFPDLAYVNLEDMEERRFAQNDPKEFLRRHAGGTVID